MSELLQPGDRVFRDQFASPTTEHWSPAVDTFRDENGTPYHYPRAVFVFMAGGVTVVRRVSEWRFRSFDRALLDAVDYIASVQPPAPSIEDAVKHLHA